MVDTRTLCAVVRCAAIGGPITLGKVAESTGYRSQGQISASLHRLRDQGLVSFEDGKYATLRPCVYEVGLPL